MPRCVVALLVAFGLAAFGGGSAAAEGGIDAAGQVFLTFDFGGDRVERRGPRFGLKLGLQGDRAPGSLEPEPFISAMSLRVGMAGPAELSLGGLTMPLNINPFDDTRDDRAGEQLPQDLVPEPAPLITAAGPTDWTDGQSPEALIAPSAGHNGRAQRQEIEIGHWRFHALPAAATPTEVGSTEPAAVFRLGSAQPVQAAGPVVERGAWRFRAWAAGNEAQESEPMGPMAQLLLPCRTADLDGRRSKATESAAQRQGRGKQVAQLRDETRPQDKARSRNKDRPPETPALDRQIDRWVFRRVVWQETPDREMTPAAFQGNRNRSIKGHLPIR